MISVSTRSAVVGHDGTSAAADLVDLAVDATGLVRQARATTIAFIGSQERNSPRNLINFNENIETDFSC